MPGPRNAPSKLPGQSGGGWREGTHDPGSHLSLDPVRGMPGGFRPLKNRLVLWWVGWPCPGSQLLCSPLPHTCTQISESILTGRTLAPRKASQRLQADSVPGEGRPPMAGAENTLCQGRGSQHSLRAHPQHSNPEPLPLLRFSRVHEQTPSSVCLPPET